MSNDGARQAIRMVKVTKTFPGTIAVNEVDFEARYGEVHAIVGENGAGKSTLMGILAGAYPDYRGEIFVGEQKVALFSPAVALRHGIGMIYQELSLARPLSIAENLLAGRVPVRFGFWVKRTEMERAARERLQRVGLEVNPFVPVEEISQHEAQLVEIAKVLGNNPRIIVMDEPTSALSREEVERLFCIIRNLKEQGIAIIYISHHLNEIFSIADRVTVLRDGRWIATKLIAEVSPEELAYLMVGKSMGEMAPKKQGSHGQVVLEVRDLTRYGFFRDVSFALAEGEILGVAGLTGSGRTELMRSLVGIDPVHSGTVAIRGRQTRLRSYASAISNGLSYLTEDRKTQGLFLRLRLDENIVSSILPRLCRWGVYVKRLGARIVRQVIDRLQVTPRDPAADLSNLSGGNQQKALLGKWLATESSLYILDEPTRGVDVGAKAIIHTQIVDLTSKGAAVILVSSDIPELAALSERVLVMREGTVQGELRKEMVSEKNILLAITGQGGQYVTECQ